MLRMNRHPLLPLLVITWTAFTNTHSTADELPLRDGLVLWLDAAAQPKLRQSAALPPLRNGQGVDVIFDSAAKREFTQPLADHRPLFITNGETAFWRFDGRDDFAFANGARQLTTELTVIILAAPQTNPGIFTGLFATSAADGNDYTHGLNIDFGPQATPRLEVINAEAAGASGARDLLEQSTFGAAARPFGGFHLFSVRSKIAKDGMDLYLDGFKAGSRDRLESQIGLDRMVLGGRHYSNDPNVLPFAQGFFPGDIAAVAVYQRSLSDAERSKVEGVLLERMTAITALATGTAEAHALELVKDPPPVQMLVPGFSVEELPLKLTNLDNIRCRHDGKFLALGYDGRLHLLSDSNGDGSPDETSIWWDQSQLRGPIGLALLPANDPRGEGAFVCSKSKVSLLLDRNRDGRADEEIVAATGWGEIPQNVDTLAAALDPKDGSLYFSIGCANFADAYLRDASGNSAYRLESPRGTVQRLSADFKTRETIATGVRFLCSLALNHEGDLFATEQEGATWLPNGNPLDELLHIVQGRHYGFPPRHPRHLPNVIDEPAVAEFAPQHQSTCGMIFNEGVHGGPAFGPQHWHGDAIICGESRGKIWRTKLVKTPEGYVAQTHLLACLNLLTVDACVTPKGDLLVACHTGPPDWGTGPAGPGRLFRIRWANRDAPQPVQAWASASGEFRVAFDRPLQPSDWAGAKEKIRIEAGEHVSAGDRFETMRPGYQVVRDQMAAPRRWISTDSLQLTADLRTLIVKVPPQTSPVQYAITLPIPASARVSSSIPQTPEMDVAVSLHGIVATNPTRPNAGEIILPHPSLAVAKALTAGSAEHEAFLSHAEKVTLRGQVDLSNIFQPATQPGSQLDWDIKSDAFANRRMVLQDEGGRTVKVHVSGQDKADFTHDLAAGGRLVLALDDKVRPLLPQRIYVPWMKPENAAGQKEAPLVRTDVKGNWLHGRRIFFGVGACFTCHILRGEGHAFGPELSNLIHRDRTAVLADILQPSATLNPDHTGTEVKLKNGSTLSGILGQTEPQKVIVRLPAGAQTELPRTEITSMNPMRASLMPEGLINSLTETDREDLLTFLLTNPLEPAPITRHEPGLPPARHLSEVQPLLPPLATIKQSAKPLRILLSAAAKDHGLNEHDYPLWLDRWSRLLALADGVNVTTCQNFPTREQLAEADVAMLYSNNAGWDLKAAVTLDDFQRRGGGLVLLHWSIEGHQHPKELADRVGLATGMSAFRHGEMDLTFGPQEHPITAGFKSPLHFVDETYWKLHGDPARVSVLGTAREESEPRPQLWIKETGPGRVFGCIPGHYTWTFDDPLYRILVLRGLCWAAKEQDLHRLADLVLVGARFEANAKSP